MIDRRMFDRDLLAIVRQYPAYGPSSYATLMSEKGWSLSGGEELRRRLRDLGLDNADRRKIWARKQKAREEEGQDTKDIIAEKWDNLKAVSRTAKKKSPSSLATIDQFTDLDLPILLIFSADWHIGFDRVDYDALDEDLDLIFDTEGAYLGVVGDYMNNAKPQRGSASQLYNAGNNDPDDQHDMFLYKVERFVNDDLLFGIWQGNHDDFDFKESGRKSTERMCRDAGIAYFGHGGAIKLPVGEQTYYGYVKHHIKGSTKSRPSGSGLSAFQRMSRPREAAHLDFIVSGHLHENDVHEPKMASGLTALLRCGSYQFHSPFAHEVVGEAETDRGCPSVLLYPDKHECVPFHGSRLDLACRVLTMERERYAADQPE